MVSAGTYKRKRTQRALLVETERHSQVADPAGLIPLLALDPLGLERACPYADGPNSQTRSGRTR